MTLDVFDYADKRNGLATMKYTGKATAPSVKVIDKYKYTQFCKAKDSNVFSWQRANFNTSPDLSDMHLDGLRQSQTGYRHQPSDERLFLDTAELVKWVCIQRKTHRGRAVHPRRLRP